MWTEKVEEPGHIKKLLEEHRMLEKLASEKINEYISEHDNWFNSLSDGQLEKLFREMGIMGKADLMSRRYPEAFLRIIDELRDGA